MKHKQHVPLSELLTFECAGVVDDLVVMERLEELANFLAEGKPCHI